MANIRILYRVQRPRRHFVSVILLNSPVRIQGTSISKWRTSAVRIAIRHFSLVSLKLGADSHPKRTYLMRTSHTPPCLITVFHLIIPQRLHALSRGKMFAKQPKRKHQSIIQSLGGTCKLFHCPSRELQPHPRYSWTLHRHLQYLLLGTKPV